MNISIFFDSGLLDVSPRLEIKGIPHNCSAKLICSTFDTHQKLWKSWAVFRADESGIINPSTQAPEKGKYAGIDPWGLFWSMEPVEHNVGFFLPPPGNIWIKLQVEIDGAVVESAMIERKKGNDDLQRFDIREHGLIGTLFLPSCAPPWPAVLVIGGGSGGIPEARAKLLASRGIAAFAIGYFGMGHLPRMLEKIPIDYFQTAFDFLSSYPGINRKHVSLFGISRGAELSLLFASLIPNPIHSIVVHVPSSIVWGNFSKPDLPAWTWKGSPIPHACASFEPSEPLKGRRAEDPIGTSALFKPILDKKELYLPFAIPVERIRSPLLCLFGKDDETWPSAWFCEQIEERLKKHGNPIPHTQVGYPNAGHLFALPGIPTTRSSYLHLPSGLWLGFGGTPSGNASAHCLAWEKTVEFLNYFS